MLLFSQIHGGSRRPLGNPKATPTGVATHRLRTAGITLSSVACKRWILCYTLGLYWYLNIFIKVSKRRDFSAISSKQALVNPWRLGMLKRLFVCLSISLSGCLSVYLSVCLSVYMSVYLSVCLSVYLSV